MTRRALTVAGAALLLAVGCNPQGSPTTTPSDAPSPGISIPVAEMPPEVKCLMDNGFVVKVVPPALEGGQPGYKYTTDLPLDQARAITVECMKLASPRPELTEADIRVVYDRWVSERDCLIELGYRPVEPPSFETFLASWKTGPWMPIDGIDTNSWTDAQYQEAKQRCKLEFFDRD